MPTSWREAEVVCPFYRADRTRSIICSGFTDDSRVTIAFETAAGKNQQMDIFCCTENCTKCEMYSAAAERFEY